MKSKKRIGRKIETEKEILISNKDKEIFFNALLGKEEGPNEALLSAIQLHSKLVKS